MGPLEIIFITAFSTFGAALVWVQIYRCRRKHMKASASQENLSAMAEDPVV